MHDLKTSAFGGYNKKQVDALVLELENKVKDLTANGERLQAQLKEANLKLYEEKSDGVKAQNEKLSEQNRALSERISVLEEENARLQSDLAALKTAALSEKTSEQAAANENWKSKNHMIKAYANGYDIVQQSLMLSDNFFKDVQEIYKNAELSAVKAIDEYETVSKEIDALLSYINSHIVSVRDETEDLIFKAKAITSMLSQIDTVKQTARLYARKKVNEYQQTAAEFIQRPNTEPEIGYESEPAVTSAKETPDAQAAEEPAAPETDSESSNESAIADADIPQSNATVSEPEESLSEFPESPEAYEEPVPSPAESPEVHEEKTEVDSAAVKPETRNTESSFTQFGHKSHISSEERAQLIKKVLTSKNDR